MNRQQEIRQVVSPNLFLRAIFGGFFNQFGWMFFSIGMVFFWAFISFDDFFYLSGELKQAKGQVLRVEDTSAEVNDVEVQRITFSFVHPDSKSAPSAENEPGKDSGLIESYCYETGTRHRPGQKVTIEFSPQRPDKARIIGTRRGIFPAWVLLLVSIFPCVGIAFILFGINRGMKICKLLKHSLLTYGVLIDRSTTSMRINHRPVMQLTFSFETLDGRQATSVAYNHEYEHLVDEAEKPLLYNPYRPEESCMLDDIPGRPRLDENGILRPREKERIATTLLWPAVALLVNLIGILLQL